MHHFLMDSLFQEIFLYPITVDPHAIFYHAFIEPAADHILTLG